MRLLYHLWLSPFSRIVRIVLAEKGLEFDMTVEKVWERRPDFIAMNPTGKVPVLVEPDGEVLCESSVICEFLDEMHPDPPLIFSPNPFEKAEVRRLVNWFNLKFDEEVNRNILFEKLMKRFLGMGQPDTSALRAGQQNIETHLSYIDYLMERRKWLAGDRFSLADIAAAAHLSSIDYLDNVPWDGHDEARAWYARIKSRPSFRPILADFIPGLPPPAHYADLDF